LHRLRRVQRACARQVGDAGIGGGAAGILRVEIVVTVEIAINVVVQMLAGTDAGRCRYFCRRNFTRGCAALRGWGGRRTLGCRQAAQWEEQVAPYQYQCDGSSTDHGVSSEMGKRTDFIRATETLGRTMRSLSRSNTCRLTKACTSLIGNHLGN
jgi:hypothetical protein